jgi:type II secretory pathway pseudopilin PulG
MKKAQGLTLLEMIIVLGLLSFIFFLGFDLVNAVQNTTARQGSKTVEQIFQAAAERARNGEAGGGWGVYVPYNETSRRTSVATVFFGSSYAARDTSLDISYPVSPQLVFESFKDDPASVGNDHEIVFGYLTGHVATAAEIVVGFSDGQIKITFSETGIPVYDPL